VRATGGYGATGIPNNAAGDLIIDQYFGQNLNATDVIAAYTQHWIHGTEIRRDGGGNRQVSLDGGAH